MPDNLFDNTLRESLARAATRIKMLKIELAHLRAKLEVQTAKRTPNEALQSSEPFK